MATYTNQILVYVDGRTQKITAADALVIGGAFTAASFSGDGSALTALNASNVSSGTLADARLSANVALYDAAAPTFTNTVSAAGFSGDGSALTSLNASNVSSGTLADGRLSSNVPLKDAVQNVFTGSISASGFIGAGDLITGLDAGNIAYGTMDDSHLSANVPLLNAPSNAFTGGLSASTVSGDGAGLTNLDGSNIASGTVADARLSGNVALYDAAAPTFTNTVSAAAFSGSGASLTSLNASNVSSGTLADARLTANVALYDAAAPTFTNTVAAAGFSGDGSALTNLNGSNIASGTVADARLSANVPLKNAASNAFSGSMSVGGDLVVAGDVISAGAQSVVIGDNFLDLNAANTITATPSAGGLSVSVQAQGTAFTATAFTAGVAGVSNPVITVSSDPSGDLTNGYLIQVSGTADGKNDGQYVVHAVTSTTIEVKGIGTDAVPAYLPFAHNQFVTSTGESATVTNAIFSVFAASNGDMYDAASNAIPAGRWAQAKGSVQAEFNGGWIPADSTAGATLQSAYNNGNTINLTDARPLTIEPEAGATAAFSITGNANSTISASGANLTLSSTGAGNGLNLTSQGEVYISAVDQIVLAGPTVLPAQSKTLVEALNTSIQYTLLALDGTGAFVAADADTADVVPLGSAYNSSLMAGVPGTEIRVLGETGGSWGPNVPLFVSSEAGKVTNVPPTSGRVYRVGVSSGSFADPTDPYAVIRWAPQYIADL